MLRRLLEIIKKVQNSDNRAKKRWVIAATAVTMVLVTIMWLNSINNLIKPAYDQNPNFDDSTREFWPVMKNGLSVLTASLKKQIGNLISKIMIERSVTIEK